MGVIDGLIGAGTSMLTDFMNQSFAREQNDITRQREDTAVQRRAKDMEAAGFNPVLAAGNPAGAQALSLPQLHDPGQAAMAMMRGAQDVATSAAEKVRIEEATKQVKAQTRGMEADAKMKENQASQMDAINTLFSKGFIDKDGNLQVPEGSDFASNPYLSAALAQLRQQVSEGKGADILNALRGAQEKEASASGGLKELDLSTLRNLGGGAAANAGLQVLLTLLRAIK